MPVFLNIIDKVIILATTFKFLFTMKNAFLLFFVTFTFIVSNQISSQTKNLLLQDSLNGFDETGFISKQVAKGISGNKLKSILNVAKKEFIFEKYHHNHNGSSLIWKTAQTTSVNPGCTNMDFETGSFAGWTVTSGINTNSSTMAGCCPSTTGIVSQVINSAGNDITVGGLLPLASPFGGTKIARINNNSADYSVERITQSFSVTSSNAIFQYAYSGVLEDAAHACTDQPYMNISVIDATGNVLPCPKIDIAAPSPLCSQSSSVTSNWISYSGIFTNVFYHAWEVRTIDLSPYIGSSITIQITVGDCIQGGHFGYGYFDCRCLPLEIILNGITYDATPQTPINLSTCGALTASITAPTGLDPYIWNGPPSSGISGATTQSIVTSTPGTYTLNMNPLGGCIPVTKYIILHTTPNPIVTNITSQATCTNATGAGTIIVNSGTAPFIYNWQPAASTNSLATGLSPGNDYTVTVVDTFGCQNTTIVSIASFTNGPTYTITPLSGALTCANTTIAVTANTDVNTTALWIPTTASNTFTVNTPGTYSCVLTNTLSSCTSTVPVIITQNTVTPTATYTLGCNVNTISLSANSSIPGAYLTWTPPSGPIPGNPGTSLTTGVFTLTVTNPANSCINTYTVYGGTPIINITNTPATNVLTCITQTISMLASTSNTTDVITWYSGTTTNTVNPYNVSAGGTFTAIATSTLGSCSSQSVITITTNTTASINITVPSSTISCLTNSLALTANGVGGTYSYTWIPSVPLFVGNPFNVTNAGTYTVNGINSVNGCTATATQSVTHETVTASFIADPYQGLMPLPVSFTNTSINPSGTTYSWDLGNSAINYTNTVVTTTYNTQGLYPVVLTATKGFCSDTAKRLIKVDLISYLTIPNVFTPNGDLINDVFTLNAINMGEIYMTVFDRWGLKMFESTASGQMSWDGKNKGGHIVSDGTYFYVIKATGLDDKLYELNGTINVFK